jgi:cobalt-zinc-cadmium efflux system outer membrane protein
MMRAMRCAFPLLFALAPAIAIAEPITRAAAVNEALGRSVELRAARARVGVSEADVVRAARLLRVNPVVEGEYGDDLAFGHHGEYRAGVSLSQEIELAGQRGLRRAAAGARLDEAHARVRDLELRVARDAADAWLAMWRADKLRALAAQTVELDAGLARVAASRRAVGDISEVEQNVVDLDVMRAQADALAADVESRRARAQLARLIGRPGGELSAVEESLPPALADTPPANGGERRADLAAARRAEDAAAVDVRLRGRELAPSPTVSFGYGRERLFVEGAGLTLAHEANLLVGRLSLPLPLWDRQQAEVRAAAAALDGARADREGVERQIAAELEIARAAVDGTQRALALYRAALPRADRNLELLGRAYQAGQIALPELLAARDRALAVRRESVEAQASYARAYHDLMRASGRLPTEQP